MQINKKTNSNADLKVYDRKIYSGAVGFTSGFSREIAHGGSTNYCWAIDRTSNNHDDIQAIIIIQASHPRLVDRLLPASTTITPHIDRYPACIQCIKFMEK